MPLRSLDRRGRPIATIAASQRPVDGMCTKCPLGIKILTPGSAPACLLPPNADLATFAGRAAIGQTFGGLSDEHVVQLGDAALRPHLAPRELSCKMR